MTVPAIRPHPTSLVIAADASLTVARKGRGHAAWAWVDSRGRYDSGQLTTTNILLAELTAIEHALAHVRDQHATVTILTDSKPAVRALQTLATTGTQTLAATTAHHRATAQTVRRITTILRYYPGTRVCWTRGHAGHPLNDAADRIARHTRIAAGVTTPQVTALRAEIAATAATTYLTPHAA